MNISDSQDFLTTNQAAKVLHCSDDSIRNWTTTGFKGIILRSKPAGRRTLIRPQWIDEFQAAIEMQKTASRSIAIKVSAPSIKTLTKAKSTSKRYDLGKRTAKSK